MTWGTVLAAIGKGILKGAGSKLFSSLIGNREPDYVGVILSALQDMSIDLKRNFKEELNKIETKRAEAALSSAIRKVRQYNLSPDTRKDVLDEITIDITDAISNLERLGPSGLGSYIICVGLEIAIIQERARVLNKKELKIAVCDTIIESAKHIQFTIEYFKTWNKSRFTEIKTIDHLDKRGEPAYSILYYTFENKRYSTVINFNDRGTPSDFDEDDNFRKKREIHIENEWGKFYSSGLNHIVDSQKRFENWSGRTGIKC